MIEDSPVPIITSLEEFDAVWVELCARLAHMRRFARDIDAARTLKDPNQVSPWPFAMLAEHAAFAVAAIERISEVDGTLCTSLEAALGNPWKDELDLAAQGFQRHNEEILLEFEKLRAPALELTQDALWRAGEELVGLYPTWFDGPTFYRPKGTAIALLSLQDQVEFRVRRYLKHARLTENASEAESVSVAVESVPDQEADFATEEESRLLFRRRGNIWEVGFMEEKALIQHLKGLFAIHKLLSRPNQPVLFNELLSGPLGEGTRSAVGPEEMGDEEDREGLGEANLPTAQLLFDEEARQDFEQRYLDLQEELEEAQEDNDYGRVEKIEAELDALTEHVSSASGLGDRSREMMDGPEKAAHSVSGNLRTAYNKLRDNQAPQLAEHLEAHIAQEEKVYFRYAMPAHLPEWRLE